MPAQVTVDEVLAEAHKALGEALVRERLLGQHVLRLEAELAALKAGKPEAEASA